MAVRRTPVKAMLLALALAALAPALTACGSAPDDEVSRRVNDAKKGL